MLLEFDLHNTKESRFAYLCDKIEADIQAKVYEDFGWQRPLDDQTDNVVFNNPKAKEIVAAGAKSAFDVWYEWDKDKYANDPVFKEALEYVKNHNTNL